MAEKIPVLHRDRTFEYRGESYRAVRQGPRGSGDDCYEVYRESDGKTIDDGTFFAVADLRAHLKWVAENGWPLIAEGDDAVRVNPL